MVHFVESVNGNGVHGVVREAPMGEEGAERGGRARNGEGRDGAGKFVKGNKGGPGNPYNREVARIKRSLLTVMTEEETVAIARKLVEDAKKGNVAAARVLFQYTMPKNVDPDQVDLMEWEQLKKEAGMMRDLPLLLGAPKAELPLGMVRGAKEGVTGGMARVVGNLLALDEEEVKAWKGMEAGAGLEWVRKGAGGVAVANGGNGMQK